METGRLSPPPPSLVSLGYTRADTEVSLETSSSPTLTSQMAIIKVHNYTMVSLQILFITKKQKQKNRDTTNTTNSAIEITNLHVGSVMSL